MKKVLLGALVVSVLFGFSGNAYADTTPFQATLTLTGFGGGTQEQHGSEFLIRDLLVTGDLSGDITGTDEHNYNANFNLVTGVGQTWGTFTMEVTGGLCTGTLSGTFQGSSVNGDFPDQDSGTFTMHGSGGCEGITVHGSSFEPEDAVFELTGFITP